MINLHCQVSAELADAIRTACGRESRVRPELAQPLREFAAYVEKLLASGAIKSESETVVCEEN